MKFVAIPILIILQCSYCKGQNLDSTKFNSCEIASPVTFKGVDAKISFTKYFYSLVDSTMLLEVTDTGRILIQFSIEVDGSIVEIKFNYGKDSLDFNHGDWIYSTKLFEEAKQIIQNSKGHWKPSVFQGEAVRQNLGILIRFPFKQAYIL